MLLLKLVSALFAATAITASPTPPSYDALAERDADAAQLDRRLSIDLGLGLGLGKDSGECKDWWKINLCKLKGTGWICNSKCDCDYHPPEKQCPDWVKKDCENKHNPRFYFDHKQCKCVDKGCDKWEKEKCIKNGGKFSDENCHCEPKPACPEHVKKDCENKHNPRFYFDQKQCKCVDKEKCLKAGGKFSDENCHCEPKPACPEHVKRDCEAKKNPRFVYNKEHCRCDDVGCPKDAQKHCEAAHGTYNTHECKCTYPPKCNEHEQHDCLSKGGKFDDKTCVCTPKPKPVCNEHEKHDCLSKGGRYDDHKCVCTPKPEPVCNEHEKHQCLSKGGKYDDHKCVCTPKPKPVCDAHKKEECNHWNGYWQEKECKCYPKEHEPCKDWLKVLLCKKLGKSCNKQCSCF